MGVVANIWIPLGTVSGKSLANNRYNSGPMTGPCGTPLLTYVHDDSTPSTITIIVRLIRKVIIQFQRFLENPYFLSFVSNRSCGVLSNASRKSRYMTLRLLSFLQRIVTPNKWAHLVTFASPHLNPSSLRYTAEFEQNHKIELLIESWLSWKRWIA